MSHVCVCFFVRLYTVECALGAAVISGSAVVCKPVLENDLRTVIQPSKHNTVTPKECDRDANYRRIAMYNDLEALPEGA